jgi:hypothetical protein
MGPTTDLQMMHGGHQALDWTSGATQATSTKSSQLRAPATTSIHTASRHRSKVVRWTRCTCTKGSRGALKGLAFCSKGSMVSVSDAAP